MDIRTPQYWEKYGYELHARLDGYGPSTRRPSKYDVLRWKYIKELKETPANYIIVIDSSLEEGKFGRTKNMKTRMKGYVKRGGDRVQDRIQNSLYDMMLRAYKDGKSVELYVRSTEGGKDFEMVNDLEMCYLPDVENFEKQCANKYREVVGRYPIHYNPC